MACAGSTPYSVAENGNLPFDLCEFTAGLLGTSGGLKGIGSTTLAAAIGPATHTRALVRPKIGVKLLRAPKGVLRPSAWPTRVFT